MTQGRACKSDWHILSLERGQHYDKRLVKRYLTGFTVKYTNIHLVGRENTRKKYKYKEIYTQANTILRPDRRPSPPQEYY